MHIRVFWNCWFFKPPSTGRVFDFIGVSLDFGLSIWICICLLNLRFSQFSCCAFMFHDFLWTWDFPLHLQRVVFLMSYAFSLYVDFTYLDVYVFFETTFFSNLMLSVHCSTNSYEHEIPHSIANVLCFWFHMFFPSLWLTYLDLYVFVEFTMFQKSIVSY